MTLQQGTLKQLWLVLIIEILTVPLVIAYFHFIEPKKVAAVVAASTFIIAGFIILKITRKWPDAYASFVYWLIHIHLFVFSIPMLVGRIAFWQKDFDQIRFIFFSGPEFHQISEKAYSLLILGTVVDIVVHTVKAKKLREGGERK